MFGLRQVRIVVLVSLMLGGGLVLAGPPGTWTKIGLGTGHAALLRTPDGKLHMAWSRIVSSKGGLAHLAIATSGTFAGKIGAVVSGWSGVHGGPQLVPDGTGLRLVFSGIKGPASDPYSSGAMYTATSRTGTAWTLGPGSLSQNGYAYASAGTGATAELDGTPVASWSFGIASVLYWHAGVDSTIPATTPDHQIDLGNCCNLHSALATDSVSGTVWLAWYAGSSGASNGFFTRPILPKLGPKKKAPSSSVGGSSIDPSQDLALSARKGKDGVYLAYGQGYPTIKRVALLKLGTSTVRTVPDSAGATLVDLAAGPDGRLWVLWYAGGALHAVLSDSNVNGFGPVQTIQPPPGTVSVYGLQGEGSLGTLDIVVNVMLSDGNYWFWHTQAPAA